MRNVYRFENIIVRQALPSESCELLMLKDLSRLESACLPISYEDIEDIRSRKNALEQASEMHAKDKDMTDFVVETSRFNSVMPVKGSMGQQLGGCMANYMVDNTQGKEWHIGWLYPVSSIYPFGEALLAAAVIQAIEMKADVLVAHPWAQKQREFMEAAGMFQPSLNAPPMKLIRTNFMYALENLSNHGGHFFNM